MINIIKRYLYKRYQKGKCKIIVSMYPDHHADYMDIGHVLKLTFKSGNIYRCRFIKSTYADHGFYLGTYEITNDIQELSYDQFSAFNLHNFKIGEGKLAIEKL